MKLLPDVFRKFGVSEDLTLCEIIVTGIAVSVMALIYLSFVASLLVFHHWSVTTMESLLLVYVALEIKIYWLSRKNSIKLLRMYDRIEQMYYQHHHHHLHRHKSKLDLSTWYFLASSFSFLLIQIYFNISTKNDLIHNVLLAGKNLQLLYVIVIITKCFASTLFLISLFVCFQMRSLFFNLYIEKFKNESFHLFIKEDMNNFYNFYVSNKFAFIRYIVPLEKLNTLCLVFYNLYLIFAIIIIYTFNCNILEIFFMIISSIILNTYYILNYLIQKRKRRITIFISTCIISMKKFIENEI